MHRRLILSTIAKGRYECFQLVKLTFILEFPHFLLGSIAPKHVHHVKELICPWKGLLGRCNRMIFFVCAPYSYICLRGGKKYEGVRRNVQLSISMKLSTLERVSGCEPNQKMKRMNEKMFKTRVGNGAVLDVICFSSSLSL